MDEAKWQERVDRLEKLVQQAKEEAKAYRQLNDLNGAILAAVLQAGGHTDTKTALQVRQEEINGALERLEIMSSYAPESREYLMYAREKRKKK